jgi:hypothetical protein
MNMTAPKISISFGAVLCVRLSFMFDKDIRKTYNKYNLKLIKVSKAQKVNSDTRYCLVSELIHQYLVPENRLTS